MNDIIVRRPLGRPAKTAAPETPQARVARLQAELETAEAQLRAEANKQALVVGHAVVAEMEKDVTFGRQLSALLRRKVTRKGDLAIVSAANPQHDQQHAHLKTRNDSTGSAGEPICNRR